MLGWQKTWAILKEAYESKKKIKAIFSDDSEGDFEVTSFEIYNGLPTWKVFPEAGVDIKFTEARYIELIE